MVARTESEEEMTKPYRKYQVQYIDEGSAEEHCSLCEHYINKTECAIVQGKINPDGWCKKFKKK